MIDLELFRVRLLLALVGIGVVFATQKASSAPWYGTGTSVVGVSQWRRYEVTFTGTSGGTVTLIGSGGSQPSMYWINGTLTWTGSNYAGPNGSSWNYNNTTRTTQNDPLGVRFCDGVYSLTPPVVDPVSTDIVLDGPDGGSAELWVDENGDGELDYIGEFAVDGDGQGSMPYEGHWNGRKYEVRLKSLDFNGQTMPYDKVVGTGTFGSSGVSVTGTLGVEKIGSAGTINLDPIGQVETAEVTVSEAGLNGSVQTAYTYNDASGNSTSIVYATSGASGVTAADTRLAAAQNTKENAAIIAALKEISAKLPATVTSGTIATPGGPALPGDHDESQGDAITEKVLDGTEKASAIVDGAKVAIGSMPAISASVGSSLIYGCTLPVLGEMSLNLTPHATLIGHFRNFLKFILSLVAWAVMVRILRGAFV